jgi:hypothetical protein
LNDFRKYVVGYFAPLLGPKLTTVPSSLVPYPSGAFPAGQVESSYAGEAQLAAGSEPRSRYLQLDPTGNNVVEVVTAVDAFGDTPPPGNRGSVPSTV